ncbi:hypothetical protein E2562_004573 [Oryza meyeriana var. granulata]|uniref:SEC7 domain-containing protein n=1 Tax=Oryza meyeriana var. granulata TaxID=110450 RepID=A0A6G1F3N3_9ORYZ|nr:hypothetical protein E2562_004573 [Oryza meyeriana var. granulata]
MSSAAAGDAEAEAESLGCASPAGRVLARALDKVIKHSSWRKHSALVAASKSALDLLSASASASDSSDEASSVSPIPGVAAAAADAALGALLIALDPASPKVTEPALECVSSLLSLRLLHGEVAAAADNTLPVSKLFAAVISCGGLGDESLELAALRVLVAFARCPVVSVGGDCLGQIVKACYNLYLGSASGGNQLCAKLALAQVLAIVFARVEADAMDVRVRTVSAADMMDLSDRSLNDSSVVQAAQAFINEAMEGSDVPEEVPPLDVPAEADGSGEDEGMSRIREDGLALFKNLCKLSMKFATPDNPDDPVLLRGKKGIALFNRKPSKGIDFLVRSKKIGHSPEDVASFLKNTAGLNATMIGDYLGERDDFPLKVMHAYVDALNFKGMDFGEAIRFFLQGFRLPGEAQKIDRIMEKFAERYCKCNPNAFTSADTAYILAYSVILLNTDAHSVMVKDKMSKADFMRNNRGIDNGKDLPEAYLSALYDQIVNKEIKMSADSSTAQIKQPNSISKLLGLDNIINFVNWGQAEDKALGANDLLIKHIQEKFKAKCRKSESVFYIVSDATILRFMMEACWAPMMAAFSVTLDQSDDKASASQCLKGLRFAVHITSVMCMQTQRDAFLTSIAKFTSLHSAVDMKQKNVDAMKAIISIAIEDGNYLQEAWEHVLTCLSRFEHLHLLGEGVPTDSSFLTVPLVESEQKNQKFSSGLSSKRINALQNPGLMAAVRGGSYDSTVAKTSASSLVTPEQISNFISNLNLLDQIGIVELNHIFTHSQRLNSDAIVAFVKALCKVSMTELQSPTNPRIFCLTKIVEVAHYNVNRIRLVWSRIWKVLSEFFVSVGLLENLSVAIFVMDSLRQLAMKFLEREELANYNFQNEFLRPFVIVMQKSNAPEVRELIVRCVSQMVLSRVNNIKSGWKGVFMVFTSAAADDAKSIVLLAFETMEKIVRDYFPYITETENTTFTDCVNCLIAFTSSQFNSDANLNAIAFLRFCAVKLADEGFGCQEKCADEPSNLVMPDGNGTVNKDDYISLWIPLLVGLAKLTSDSRSTIKKSATGQ